VFHTKGEWGPNVAYLFDNGAHIVHDKRRLLDTTPEYASGESAQRESERGKREKREKEQSNGPLDDEEKREGNDCTCLLLKAHTHTVKITERER
jgi:hypothetical protein